MSPRSLLRSLKVSMIAARSWHLSQTGHRRGDSGEAGGGGREGGNEVLGGGEKGREEVEDVEVGRGGGEACNPTSCQRCRTTRPYSRRDSRGGRAQCWSQGVVEKGWAHRMEPRRGKFSLRRMSGDMDAHRLEPRWGNIRPQEDGRGWAASSP
jgi:hypothetical protein